MRAAEPQRLGEGRLLLPLVYDGPSAERVDVASALRAALVADERGATVRIVGTPAIWSNFQEVSEQQLARAELYGFPIVVLILLAAFGTVVACLAPLVLGVAAVVVTGACVYFLAGTIQMSVYVTNVASMIGIGVAVDYSLFVVSRFRRELRSGARVEAALRRSMASAGTAVVFSGLTVVLSLAGLLLVDVNAVRSIAIGAILVVSVAVLATATLLPALLALVGRRIERLRVRLPGRRRPEGEFWMRWSARVMRHPVPALVGGVAVMLALAAPLLDLRTENHGLAQLPRDAEVRVAMERVAAVAGPGALAPIHVLTDDRAAAARIAAELRGVAGIEAVGAPVASRDGSRFLVEAVQSDDPESNAAQATYERATRVARSTAPDASVVLGGTTAFGMAVEKSLTSGVWQIMLFVLAGAYLVLLVLLRSVVLPLKAVLMNLLSIGAAYGVLVAVFQWGWLDWTGYDSPGYLDTTVPTLVLAVVVRPLDGLRGLPADPHPRAIRGRRLQRAGGQRGARRQRAHDHGGRGGHGRRVRHVRDRRRAGAQGAWHRPRSGRARRRHDRAAADRPRRDAADGHPELVDAGGARPPAWRREGRRLPDALRATTDSASSAAAPAAAAARRAPDELGVALADDEVDPDEMGGRAGRGGPQDGCDDGIGPHVEIALAGGERGQRRHVGRELRRADERLRRGGHGRSERRVPVRLVGMRRAARRARPRTWPCPRRRVARPAPRGVPPARRPRRPLAKPEPTRARPS